MKLVDIEQIYCSDCEYRGNCRNVSCYVKEMPVIDAEPVIRCRECKHWSRYTKQWENHCAGECERHRMEGGTYENNFCSYGQRREDDHDKHPSDPV